jgi:hypothetical protein
VTVGTKSLLVGVHQLYLHPLTVGLAWRSITGRWPTWREWVCIVLHDVGYVGVREMDGPDGARHPELGARLAGALFGPAYRDLVAYHSRHAAIKAGREPSLLCWADKLSILYECWWTYLPRAWFQQTSQGKSSLPHYDLVPSKRRLAVEAGAVEMSYLDYLVMTRGEDEGLG